MPPDLFAVYDAAKHMDPPDWYIYSRPSHSLEEALSLADQLNALHGESYQYKVFRLTPSPV